MEISKKLLVDLLDEEPAIGILSNLDSDDIETILRDTAKRYFNLKEKFTDVEFDSMMIAIMSKLSIIATIENMEDDYVS